jgi:hypothetical protein
MQLSIFVETVNFSSNRGRAQKHQIDAWSEQPYRA